MGNGASIGSSGTCGDGARTSFVTMSDADESSASWSPDGARIAYVERTRGMQGFSAEPGVKSEPRLAPYAS